MHDSSKCAEVSVAPAGHSAIVRIFLEASARVSETGYVTTTFHHDVPILACIRQDQAHIQLGLDDWIEAFYTLYNQNDDMD